MSERTFRLWISYFNELGLDGLIYSPDFNPIERLWQHLKSHHLAGFITKDGEALGEKIFQAIRSLLQTPETIRSFCRTHSE